MLTAFANGCQGWILSLSHSWILDIMTWLFADVGRSGEVSPGLVFTTELFADVGYYH